MAVVAGCSRGTVTEQYPVDPDGHSLPHPGMQKCFFRVIGGSPSAPALTKVTSVDYSNESRINRWGLYIFDSSQNYVVSAASSEDGGIVKYLDPGTYTVCAIVNYPVSGPAAIDPSVQGGISVMGDLDGVIPRLEDMSGSSFMMYGSDTMTITAGGESEAVIDVRRLVSKVGVKKISLDWTNKGHASEAFTLKHLYLTNVFGVQSLRSDIPYGGMSSVKSDWFNAMSYHGTGSRTMTSSVESMTSDRSINHVIADGGSYTTEHYFYALPNACPSGSDSRSSVWGIRSTRLVLEAECGGLTYYYSIALPPMERNKTYFIDELVIRSLGSLDPEQVVENSMSVSFGFTTSWDDIYVVENS